MKTDAYGNKNKCKSLLFARDFPQKCGEDDDSSFTPVVNESNFHILFSIATVWNFRFRYYDIRTAYLNGILNGEAYMNQPQGFVRENEPHFVYKHKTVYFLKQSTRAWKQSSERVCIQTESKWSISVHQDKGKKHAIQIDIRWWFMYLP